MFVKPANYCKQWSQAGGDVTPLSELWLPGQRKTEFWSNWLVVQAAKAWERWGSACWTAKTIRASFRSRTEPSQRTLSLWSNSRLGSTKSSGSDPVFTFNWSTNFLSLVLPPTIMFSKLIWSSVLHWFPLFVLVLQPETNKQKINLSPVTGHKTRRFWKWINSS